MTEPAHAYRLAAIGGAGDFIQAFAFSPRGNLLAAMPTTAPCWSTAWHIRPGPPAPRRFAAAHSRGFPERVATAQRDAALPHL